MASKDIASQLMSGLALHLSDKVYEVSANMQTTYPYVRIIHTDPTFLLDKGDEVRFSDGTSGKIVELGWFETTIRNSGMSFIFEPFLLHFYTILTEHSTMNSDELVVGIPNTQVRFTLPWNNLRELLPNSHHLLSL